MSDYRVIVLTCDAYWEAVRVFAWTFGKYWSLEQPVLVGCFAPPPFDLPPNFSWLSIGDNKDYPIQKYSSGLIQFLNMIRDDVFVLMPDDFWLNGPTELAHIQTAVDLAREIPYLLRIDLIRDRDYTNMALRHTRDVFAVRDGLEFVKSDHMMPYQMSLAPSVFRRKVLLDCLRDNWTPWEVETTCTAYLHEKGESVLVLGTEQLEVHCCNGLAQDGARYKRGIMGIDAAQEQTTGLRIEDQEEMKRLGILDAKRLLAQAKGAK